MSAGKRNGRPLKLEDKKTKLIKARVTEQEYMLIKNQMKNLSLKESEYVRLKVLNPGSVKVTVNVQQVIRLLDHMGAELGRSGNNINQLARHANFLSRRGMLEAETVIKFNNLFSQYISLFRENERETRTLLRMLKNSP